MYTLSKEQKQRLIEILVEEFGCNLDFDEFAEAVMVLCDDIAGFETIQTSNANRIINQLWRNYHDHQSV
jgi:hypothetical protein